MSIKACNSVLKYSGNWQQISKIFYGNFLKTCFQNLKSLVRLQTSKMPLTNCILNMPVAKFKSVYQKLAF